MLTGLIKIIFWLITKLSEIIMLPITLLINATMPSFAQFITDLELWLDNNIWSYVHFIKQCLINVGIPQICFTFVISYYTFIAGLWAGSKLYLFCHNIYQQFKP